MREALFLVAFGTWLASVVSDHTFDGQIHILLGLITVMVLVRVLRGENPLGESAAGAQP